MSGRRKGGRREEVEECEYVCRFALLVMARSRCCTTPARVAHVYGTAPHDFTALTTPYASHLVRPNISCRSAIRTICKRHGQAAARPRRWFCPCCPGVCHRITRYHNTDHASRLLSRPPRHLPLLLNRLFAQSANGTVVPVCDLAAGSPSVFPRDPTSMTRRRRTKPAARTTSPAPRSR